MSPPAIINPIAPNEVFMIIMMVMIIISSIFIGYMFYKILNDFTIQKNIKKYYKNPNNKAINNKKGIKEVFPSNSLIPRYADVWVKSFIDPYTPSLGSVTYKDILFQGTLKTYRWSWIETKSEFGWIEKRKDIEPLPPKSMFYASSDEAFEDAKRILEEYNNDKEVSD